MFSELPLDITVFYLLSIMGIMILVYVCIALYRYPTFGKNREIPLLIAFIFIFYFQTQMLCRRLETFDSKGIADSVRQMEAIDALWNPQVPFIQTHINYMNQQLEGINNNTKLMQYTTITPS